MQFAVLFTNGKNGRSLDKRIIYFSNVFVMMLYPLTSNLAAINPSRLSIMISELDIFIINLIYK